jgi:protein-disulfide isomerase
MPIASIGGKPLSPMEFRKEAAAAFGALEQQQAAQREQLKVQQALELAATSERELRALLDRRALELESQAQGRTGLAVMGDLEVTAVAEADVKAFYLEHQAQIQQSYAEVRDQILEMLTRQRTDLDTRRFLNSLWLKHGIIARDTPQRIEVQGVGPVRGAQNAPVTLVEFSDFQCPFCVRTAPELEHVLTTYPEQVRLVYRQLPLKTIHPQAQAAAEASLCANDQGKFWAMHDELFALNGRLQASSYAELAGKLGLKMDAFTACMDQHAHQKDLDADEAAANHAGATGTPYLLVNGRSLNGAVSFTDIALLVENELLRQGIASPITVKIKPAAAATAVKAAD